MINMVNTEFVLPPIQLPVKQATVTKGRCSTPVVRSTMASNNSTKKDGVRSAALWVVAVRNYNHSGLWQLETRITLKIFIVKLF